jgi:predicted SAM-dependent methyltransferase
MLKPGRMPNEVDFEENSLGAVLTSRVLSFILPEELEISFEKIFKWLKPGGKYFFLGGSPHMGTFRKFLPTYQNRKTEGYAWPGFLEDIPFCTPERAHDLPHYINLLDEETLSRSLQKTGFIIEDLGFVSALEEHPQDMKSDGREMIGAIALKP